jgi:poly [ADP-ribose] polymerase
LEKLQKGKSVLEKSETGLVTSAGSKIPLKSMHVRAQIVDMISKVTIYQEYYNEEQISIEAKYIFPLDEQAAVCGFEAFINDKHIIGICKEKETAHREYKQAIEQGHGAYLMDQETADLFKVNVGNLPAKCTVIIKITYVAELDVQNEQIIFKLPSSVASWQKLDIVEQKLQNNLLTKLVDKLNEQNTSFKASILMPFEIKTIKSPTHKLKLKQTACQAVCELDSYDESLRETLILEISIATIHMPRMLVEDFVDEKGKTSRACMVAFYPEFEIEKSTSIGNDTVYFFLDCSNSMKQQSTSNKNFFDWAKKLLFLMLFNLPRHFSFNIILFGTEFVELFPFCMKNTEQNYKKAIEFINQYSHVNMGNTDLLNSLQPLLLLNNNSCSLQEVINNIVLITDGHICKSQEVISVFNNNNNNTTNRIFSCSVGDGGNTANNNNHLLKMISKSSGGSFESFDIQRSSAWKEKIIDLIDKLAQPCSIKNIRIEWENLEKDKENDHTNNNIIKENEFDHNVAPMSINALFNGRRIVAYGFIPNCRQATLKAEINGMEISTVVTCSELCVTRGDAIHKLILFNFFSYSFIIIFFLLLLLLLLLLL